MHVLLERDMTIFYAVAMSLAQLIMSSAKSFQKRKHTGCGEVLDRGQRRGSHVAHHSVIAQCVGQAAGRSAGALSHGCGQ